MKNGAVSYVTRNTAPFFYKAFATISKFPILGCHLLDGCQLAPV